MSGWKHFREISTAIDELASLIEQKIALPDDARIGLRTAIKVMRSTGGEEIIMFLARIIYLLRVRVINRDVEFFQGDTFRGQIMALSKKASFIDDEMQNGIHAAFTKIHGLSYVSIRIQRMLLKIINLYPKVIEEYIQLGVTPPYANLTAS